MKAEEIMKKDREVLKTLYQFMCEREGQNPIQLSFKRLGNASGCCKYTTIGGRKIPTEIIVNQEGSVGGACVLIHEFAHKVLIRKKNDATHSAEFRKELKRLSDIYEDCDIARKITF